MRPSVQFDYDLAFSRNMGWVRSEEQQVLKSKRVAIAGLGGVGGVHLMTLARLGVGRFHIADLDQFEVANFNRQYGADMSTLGAAKTEVMKAKALLVNPEADIVLFSDGVSEGNIDAFLEGVDIYVDGLDFFQLEIRRSIFRACKKKGIAVITVGPIGMGSALLCFTAESMSFDDYCGFTDDPIDNYLRFLVGVTPNFLHVRALVDRSKNSFKEKKAGSTAMGCQLAAGVMGTEVLKHLLKRGPILTAPRGYHFDAYSYRGKKSWMPWGARNPFFRLKLMIVKRVVPS